MVPSKWKCISDQGTTVGILQYYCSTTVILLQYSVCVCVSIFTAKDVVRKLLVVDPSKRMTIEEALQHPWLQVHLTHSTAVLLQYYCSTPDTQYNHYY